MYCPVSLVHNVVLYPVVLIWSPDNTILLAKSSLGGCTFITELLELLLQEDELLLELLEELELLLKLLLLELLEPIELLELLEEVAKVNSSFTQK